MTIRWDSCYGRPRQRARCRRASPLQRSWGIRPGTSRVGKTLRVAYANVSLWSPVVDSYLASTDDSVIGLVEHRLTPRELAARRKRHGKWVWYGCDSVPTPGGRSAGAGFLVRTHLAARHVLPELLAASGLDAFPERGSVEPGDSTILLTAFLMGIHEEKSCLVTKKISN